MKVGEKKSTNLNYARENLPIDLICVNTAFKGKNWPDFYDCVKCFDNIEKKPEILIWTPSRNCKIDYLTKEFSWTNFWLHVINHLCRCDWYISFIMLEYALHVFKKNIWRHKKSSNIVLDITVNLCNKNVKKFARLNGFFVVFCFG